MDSFEKLEGLKSDDSTTQENTKFHCCWGSSFKTDDYEEDEWTERLFHLIKNHIPDFVSIVPSYQYKTKVPALLQKLSTSAPQWHHTPRSGPL